MRWGRYFPKGIFNYENDKRTNEIKAAPCTSYQMVIKYLFSRADF
jgi:hypothetical protein